MTKKKKNLNKFFIKNSYIISHYIILCPQNIKCAYHTRGLIVHYIYELHLYCIIE